MCNQKVIRKNHIAKFTLNGATSQFNERIDLNFAPDVVKIKYIHYYNNATGTQSILVWSSLVNDYIGTVADTEPTIPFDITFDMRKLVQGTHVFSTHDETGAFVTETGRLVIHLEFLKYID